MQKKTKEIIQKLSNKYNLPERTIEHIVNHPFKATRDFMKKGPCKIRMTRFCSFTVQDSYVMECPKCGGYTYASFIGKGIKKCRSCQTKYVHIPDRVKIEHIEEMIERHANK